MELQHLIIKIPVEGPLGLEPAKSVDVFHQWVARQVMPGVLLVDVAELLHVPNGPGVIAVGVEADFALDHTGGSWGVLYRRKTILGGTNQDRILQAIASAAQTALRLQEAFPGALNLSSTEFDLSINDRGMAPNTAGTYAAATPDLEAGLRAALGHGEFKLTRHDREPRQRFGVTVKSAAPFELAVLARMSTRENSAQVSATAGVA
ncbi:MAG: hypothetical protein ABSH48_25360 [Verrucomicrobiota bacterium]|jgi:hypothetical protein